MNRFKLKQSLLFLCLTATIQLFAQENSLPKDSLQKDSLKLLNFPEVTLDTNSKGQMPTALPTNFRSQLQEKPLKMTFNTEDLKLKYTPSLRPLAPWELHQSGGVYRQFSRQFAVGAFGSHEYIPGVGLSRNVNAGLIYRPNNRWTFQASSMFHKSHLSTGHFNDFQFSGSATYRINDYMEISGFGHYSVMGERNWRRGAMPVNGYNAGYNGAGATFNLKVINASSWELWMKSGMEYQYNPATMRWKWKPVITPELRFK